MITDVVSDDWKRSYPKAPRVLAHVHSYDGPDPQKVVADLLADRFTGPITLHVSAGRVSAIEWREKIPLTAPP